jgi:uncharacterized membrane protein
VTTTSEAPGTVERHGSDRPAPSTRLVSVDQLRGLVMVAMLLDHTRDYFADPSISPTDLTRASAALFLTRWITHFCAPVFVFLAGTGAYLAGRRGKSRGQLARYLVVRGLLLIVLEATVVKYGLLFRLAPQSQFALVLWAIGWSMIALAGLVFLPTRLVGAFGVAMIAAHNLLDGIQPDRLGALRGLWLVLHQPGLIRLGSGMNLFVAYPLIPWVGVMASGYALGALLELEPARRRRTLRVLGLGLTVAFVVLRALNLYGDPQPWSRQPSPLFTVFSFLNCQKYPPSLLFLLMTLGPAIVLLSRLDRQPGAPGRALATIGRVPLFVYVLQWYVIHGLALLIASARGEPIGWLFSENGPPQVPPAYALGLPAVYAIWAAIVVGFYPACRWYDRLKQRKRSFWLSLL